MRKSFLFLWCWLGVNIWPKLIACLSTEHTRQDDFSAVLRHSDSIFFPTITATSNFNLTFFHRSCLYPPHWHEPFHGLMGRNLITEIFFWFHNLHLFRISWYTFTRFALCLSSNLITSSPTSSRITSRIVSDDDDFELNMSMLINSNSYCLTWIVEFVAVYHSCFEQ